MVDPMPSGPYQAEMEIIYQTPEVRVAEISLEPHCDTPPHQHTESEETCYCLQGELTCETSGQAPIILLPGQRIRFAPGQGHQLRNRAALPCRFLLIHGGGSFDFAPVTANAAPTMPI